MYEEEEEDEDGETVSTVKNQATKRDDFLAKLDACKPIMGLSLRLPLPNDRYAKLQEMFATRRRLCAEIMHKHIDDAKTLGNDYNKDLRQDPLIK